MNFSRHISINRGCNHNNSREARVAEPDNKKRGMKERSISPAYFEFINVNSLTNRQSS